MASAPDSAGPKHKRHEPEGGIWHRTLREHLLTLLAESKDPDDPDSGIPSFVERELTGVLNCGVLSAGFIRLACPDCKRSKLVAFSCGPRAACPSCGARRMAEVTSHLADKVLVDVALRQFVITAPSELRILLLADGSFLNAFIRIVVSVIFRHLGAKAAALGVRGAKPGALTFIQRFSSSLGVFPHLHVVALDGVFTKEQPESSPIFQAVSATTEREEYLLSATICERVEALLRRLGLVDPDTSTERAST